jgi:pantoate--beta-alanine ligase
MILFRKTDELREYLLRQRKLKKTSGFVPTMGALHPGHLSLVEFANKDHDLSVCSIFVNPAQFNDPEDYKKYPVTIEKDIYMLENGGCDILFLPSFEEIYPSGISKKKFELGPLETLLEGHYRPGHFQGVCLVVERLLEIVMPDTLYLGQKDYQQCMILAKLLSLIHMQDKTRISICPTLREQDGLAMSSRNLRLNEHERKTAPLIYETLLYIKNNMRPGELSSLKNAARDKLTGAGFRVDYAEIADASTLETIRTWDGDQKAVALIAAFLDEIRLIDNILIN